MSKTNYTDKELSALLRRGSFGAFRKIYYRYAHELYSLSRHVLLSKSDRYEIILEAFEALWFRRAIVQTDSIHNSLKEAVRLSVGRKLRDAARKTPGQTILDELTDKEMRSSFRGLSSRIFVAEYSVASQYRFGVRYIRSVIWLGFGLLTSRLNGSR